MTSAASSTTHAAGADAAVASVVTEEAQSTQSLTRAGEQAGSSGMFPGGPASAMPLAASAPSTGGGPPGGGGGAPPAGSLMRPPVASPAPALTQMAQPLANTQPHPPTPSAQPPDPRQAQHAQTPQPQPQPQPSSAEPPRARPSAPPTPAISGPGVLSGGPSGIQAATPIKPAIQAVDDRHTFRQDTPSPVPVDPRTMTADEARAAWSAINADIDRYNARCGRTFVLPNEQASYDACVADQGELLARQAEIRARLGDLGIPVEGGQPPPTPDPAGPQPGRGLPPSGVTPPVEGNLTEGPASRPSEQPRGGQSLWDEHGGEWRYFPGDRWHNPHWDYNPHDSPNSGWQNIPIGDLPPRI